MEYLLIGIITMILFFGLLIISTNEDKWGKGLTEGLRVRYKMEQAKKERKKKYAIYTHKYQIEHKQAVKAVDAEEVLDSIPDDGSWLNR